MKEIQDPSCRALVRKYKELAAEDIRFDVPLAEACFEDRQRLCATIPAVCTLHGIRIAGLHGLLAAGCVALCRLLDYMYLIVWAGGCG